MSGRPLRDAAGRPAAVAVSRDITAEHAQRTELETFAAVAAHDLSTPLAIIRGYLDVLADLVLPELTGTTPTPRPTCCGAPRTAPSGWAG